MGQRKIQGPIEDGEDTHIQRIRLRPPHSRTGAHLSLVVLRHPPHYLKACSTMKALSELIEPLFMEFIGEWKLCRRPTPMADGSYRRAKNGLYGVPASLSESLAR